MHLRAGGGRRAAQRPTSQCICGRAAGGKAIHISMHLRAGGGRAPSVRLGSVLGAILRKPSQKLQKILPNTSQNPTKILSKRGSSTEPKKSSFFFSFCCASWARPGRFGRRLGGVLGRLGGVLGASWTVLGCLGGVLARLGSVLGRLGRVLGRLCGACRFSNGFLMRF